jgi:hypothetical protein
MTIRDVGEGTHSSALRGGLAGLALVLVAACNTTGGGDLSGTYQTKDQNGSMTLEFKSGHKVHLTMQESGGQPDNSDGDYLIDGNKVTIQVPGGMPFVLVRSGKTLEGSMMGQILHFEKK